MSNGLFGALAYIREPSRRIYVFLALSVLLHATILWLPHLRLSSFSKGSLPALMVRFEYPSVAVLKDEQAPQAMTQSTLSAPVLSNAEAIKQEEITPQNSMKPMDKTADVRPFPKQVRLSFAIYEGKDLKKMGEMQHQLNVEGARYRLKSIKGALFPKNVQATEQSEGAFTERGFQPDRFTSEKIEQGTKKKRQAIFDWTAQKIHFQNGSDVELPAAIQDGLSYVYQLSRLSVHTEIIPLQVSDGERLLDYQIEIGSEEKIESAMGEVRAIHLRKIHLQGEPYFEIWLGLDYQMLPVKFREVGAGEQVKQERVIADIQVSDY